MAPTTRAKTKAAVSNASSTFLKLPTEMRFKIYKLALEDVISKHVFLRDTDDLAQDDRPQYKGALGFLHTSQTLRAESMREFLSVMKTKEASTAARVNRLYQAKDSNSDMPHYYQNQMWINIFHVESVEYVLEKLMEMVQMSLPAASDSEA